MLSAKAVLPMEGRAASIIRFAGWKPLMMIVQVTETGLAADGVMPLRHGPLQFGEALADQLPDGLELSRSHPGLRDVEHHLLGLVDELHGRLLAPVAHLGDLAAHLDERAQIVVLPDDLRVVAGVGGSRNRRDQAVDERPPADQLQSWPGWPAPR